MISRLCHGCGRTIGEDEEVYWYYSEAPPPPMLLIYNADCFYRSIQKNSPGPVPKGRIRLDPPHTPATYDRWKERDRRALMKMLAQQEDKVEAASLIRAALEWYR